MTLTEFVKKWYGKKIDFDHYAGVQCVDLIKQYINDVFKVKPQSIGNAKAYWQKRNGNYLKSMFVPVVNKNTTVPRRGDIFVRTSGTFGHIGICTGGGNTDYFNAWEQNNGGTGEGMTLHKHTNWSTINFLRPKVQYVKANGGLNGYSSKTSKNPCVLIPNNSKVTIIETECCVRRIKGKDYTLERVLYNGKKYYVASEYVECER